MHGCLALVTLHQYIRYRNSLGRRCPHCHQEIGNKALDPLPTPLLEEQSAVTPRESFSANSIGEAEGDTLILKS